MKVLKTIVATAVVVFAMTSVAMAGVQQLTKAQDDQAADKTRAQHTVTLTDKQLARLIDHQGSHVREAQRTKTHARRVERKHAQAQQGAHEAEARHVERVRNSVQSEQSDHSGSASPSGSHHYETSQQTHASSGGHDGGHGGGHGGD
ncbi:MAG TPA: hypothetical protein VFZ86_03995 [Thermoleophilia bacterium]|nr:hypothetical protein [Thermoleophilia bacterium]